MAPIHEAVRAGDVEAVRRELAAGVSPDLIEANISPLIIAADCRQVDITLLLIEAGADVGLQVGTFTPLHVACLHGCKATVAALLAAGGSKGKIGIWNTLELEEVQSKLPGAEAAIGEDGRVLSGAVAGMGALESAHDA